MVGEDRRFERPVRPQGGAYRLDVATTLDVMQSDGVRAQLAPECLLCRRLGHALYTGLRDETYPR
jgi:hypothetical protein